jgi:purine nucleosidase
MKSTLLTVPLLAGALILSAQPPRPSVPVIFDTDIGNDVDDCLALAILHSFASRGEVRLAAVTITKDNPWAARLASAIDTFYGRANVPVGVVHDGQTKDDGYLKKALDAGHYPYRDHPEDAVKAAAPRIGIGTRFERGDRAGGLLAPIWRALARFARRARAGGAKSEPAGLDGRRLRRRWALNTTSKPIFPSAQKLAAEWPGPVYWSGFEVGSTIKYPARSIERDFGPSGNANPVADAYRNYLAMPYDRETWDLTAALLCRAA